MRGPGPNSGVQVEVELFCFFLFLFFGRGREGNVFFCNFSGYYGEAMKACCNKDDEGLKVFGI